MAVAINSLSKKAWDRFIKEGMTKAGAASMLGNIAAESGMKTAICEYLCLQRLMENGKEYTQESYTKAVDSGKISRAEFLNPLPGRQYGYGLCQWTTPSPRKSELYDRTVGKGLSISDEDAQIEYLVYELKTRYPSVWKVLTTTNSIQEGSDKVLKDFESPSNWRQHSSLRAQYSQKYYDAYASNTTTPAKSTTSTTSTTAAINALIAVAKAEVGYLEKRSNSNLDDKTTNAGSSNYTKYWRDVYPAYQAQAWCAAFVSWCMMKAFGLETAKKLLKHWPYVYCPTMANLFTLNSNPKVGDVVIFYRNGEFAHTGLVIAVNGDQFTTIEGNTSGGSTIVPNGGGVCQKTYYNSNLPGTKFCTPDYSLVKNIQTTSTTSSSNITQTSSTNSSAVNNKTASDKWIGIVNKNNAKARKWAGKKYDQVSFSPLKKGTKIEIQYSLKSEAGNDWYYFKLGDKFAFIVASSVDRESIIYVSGGTFNIKSNAEYRAMELKNLGYNTAEVIERGGQYIVRVKICNTLAEANNLANELEGKGMEAAVIKV